MKIVVIHGSPRRGNTYEATQRFMQEMQSQGTAEFREFFLPKDMPEFCRGCFACIEKGEDKCPHAKYVQAIVSAIDEADALILTSPIYVLQLSGGLKALLDHLAYVYLNHRPRFMRKKAVIIATTAGAGLRNCIKYLTENLCFWGVNKIYSIGIQMMSIGWEDMKPERKEKYQARIGRIARLFYTDVASGRLHPPSLIQVVMFNAGQVLARSQADGVPDKEYWRQMGWDVPGSRYFVREAHLSLFKRAIGRVSRYMFARMMK